MAKLYQNRDWLWEHYIIREESSYAIAKEAGCSNVTILNWLHKMGISIHVYDGLWQDRDWLYEHYIVQKESSSAVAKEAGCSHATICQWLHKLDIPIHGNDSLWRNRDWLWEHYIAQGESTYVMAKEANCDYRTISDWLHRTNIPVRSCNEGSFFARKNSVIITPDLLKFLRGEILGDGCVSMPGNRSARYSHSSALEEYLIWLAERFNKWGIKQTGRVTDHISKKTGAIYYNYASKFYPELVPIYRRWYPNGKKTVPQDLKLTPIMARQWYLGDGYPKHSGRGRPYINLSTNDFDHPSIEYLIGELGRLGFKATHQFSNNTINISTHSTKEFLGWIGPCPASCYDYKWDYDKSKEEK